AVREVDQPDHAEDGGQAQRHQAVHRSGQGSGDDDVRELRRRRHHPILDAGSASCAWAMSLGRTTVGLPPRFWSTTDRLPSTWPLALNLIGPPKETRSVAAMFVWRIASARAFGSVVRARLNAYAAVRIASKV